MFSAISKPYSGHQSPAISHNDNHSPSPSEDEWSDYNLTWLFDPDRCDHLPMDQQLQHYKQNNLTAHKVYKVAAGIWGPPRSRKRVIIASGMPSKPSYPSQYQTKPEDKKVQTSVTAVQQHKQEEKEEDYHTWIAKRKQFRADLDGMGLNENWLQRKPNKTALEQRVLARMIEARTQRRPPTPDPEEESLDPMMADDSPVVRRPCPQAIRIIERFLHRNNKRLIDLFKNVDKDKKWLLSRDEFRKAIRQAKIPISDVLLEDLILTLDLDLNNQLDYRELAKGMALWKVEKRQSKQHLLLSPEVTASATKYGQTAGYELPKTDPGAKNCLKPKAKTQTKEASSTSAPQKPAAASSVPKEKQAAPARVQKKRIQSSSSSCSLELPDADHRSEHYPPSHRRTGDHRPLPSNNRANKRK